MNNLLEQVKITRVANAAVAGSTDLNGTGVDMTGFESVLFIWSVGTLTANQVTALHAQQSSDDAGADDYTDLEGSATPALADTASNKLLILDVVKPTKRYVRPVLDRATANAVSDGCIAVQYNPRTLPTTQPASVGTSDVVYSPDEGTA